MQIKALDHIGLRVVDVKQSIRFYKLLGFTVIRNDPKEQVVVVRHPAGIEINFIASGAYHSVNGNILMDVAERYPGYTHYAISVDSVAATKDFLEQHHLPISEGPVTFGDGKTSIFIRDPDRNVLEFTELPRVTPSRSQSLSISFT